MKEYFSMHIKFIVRVIENYRNLMGVLFQCEQFSDAYQTNHHEMAFEFIYTWIGVLFFFFITQCVQVKLWNYKYIMNERVYYLASIKFEVAQCLVINSISWEIKIFNTKIKRKRRKQQLTATTW